MDKCALTLNMDLKTYIQGAVLQSPGDIPSNLMVMVKGVAVLFTVINEEEFKLEYFKEGDVINHTLFLYQRPALLHMKCVTDCDILLLPYERVAYLREAHPESSLSRAVADVLAEGERQGFEHLYLDYIRKPLLRINGQQLPVVERRLENSRRLKNLGVRYLAGYRAKNQKPSIKDLLREAITKDKEKRKAMKLKLMQLMKNDEQEGDQAEPQVMTTTQTKDVHNSVAYVER